MEPNTQPNIETETSPTTPNKNKKMIIIISIIIIIIIVAAVLLKSKVQAPANINGVTPPTLTEQLSKDIDTATTFDNEADLKEIDSAFQ